MRSVHISTCMTVLGMIVALGLVACGDSDDGNDAAGKPAQQETDSSQPVAGADETEREVRAALAALQNSFYAGDVKAVCAGYTEAARNEIASGGGSDATCESAMGAYVRPVPASTAQRYKARIISVKVKGDKATVRSVQGQAQRPTDVRLVKEDGAWKLSQTGSPGSP